MKEGIIITELNSRQLLDAVRQIVKEEVQKSVSENTPRPEEKEAKETYNSNEAADYLRISRRTLYAKIKQKKIECSNDGNLTFTKKQLDKYLHDTKK